MLCLKTSTHTYCKWCPKHICPVQFTKQTIKWACGTIDSPLPLVKQNTLEQYQVMTLWLPDGCGDRASIRVDVPERCHRLSVGITVEQLAIVTDTEIYVSFSLFGVGVFGQKWTPLFPKGAGHKGRQRYSCQTVQHYTPTPLSAQLGSVQIIITSSELLKGCNDPTELPPCPLRSRRGMEPYWHHFCLTEGGVVG